MTIVRLCDMRSARLHYCNKGGRQFCARHGIEWDDFRKNGIDAKRLLDTGDWMAAELVKVAEKREEG